MTSFCGIFWRLQFNKQIKFQELCKGIDILTQMYDLDKSVSSFTLFVGHLRSKSYENIGTKKGKSYQKWFKTLWSGNSIVISMVSSRNFCNALLWNLMQFSWLSFRWFLFEKVIEALMAQQIYHRLLNQLQSYAKKHCFIEDTDEFDGMISFYHGLGMIIKHRSTVVLKAQWLIDLLKQLITIPHFNEMVRKLNCFTFTWCSPSKHLFECQNSSSFC